MTALTAHLTAFARPADADIAMLVIRKAETEPYRASVSIPNDQGELVAVEIASPMALYHKDGTFTPMTAEMILSAIQGKAAMMPFAAPRNDEHTFGFAAKGLTTTQGRVETAIYRETSRQNSAIEQHAAEGLQVRADQGAILSAASQAASLPGGGGYGLLFEDQVQLYNGRVCNVFVPLATLTQLLYVVYGGDRPFVHDQTNRHISSQIPLRELTVEALQAEGIAGALFLGFPVMPDGTPRVTSREIAEVWEPWQHLAESLSLVVATVSPSNNKTTAVAYIRPATLAAMVWGEQVQVVANPVPSKAQRDSTITNRVPGAMVFTKRPA